MSQTQTFTAFETIDDLNIDIKPIKHTQYQLIKNDSFGLFDLKNTTITETIEPSLPYLAYQLMFKKGIIMPNEGDVFFNEGLKIKNFFSLTEFCFSYFLFFCK